MKIVALLLSIFYTIPLYCQKVDPIVLNDFTREARIGGSSSNIDAFTTFDNRYQGLEGTYFTTSDWATGDLFGEGGVVLRKGVLIKYDAVNQQLVMKKPTGDSVAVYPKSFIMDNGNSKLFFISWVDSNEKIQKVKYLQLLYIGKIKIIKEPRKFLSRANYKDPFTHPKYTDSFEDNSKYYFADDKGNLREFKLKKSSVLNSMDVSKKISKHILSDHKIDLDTENGVINFIRYVDQLTEKP